MAVKDGIEGSEAVIEGDVTKEGEEANLINKTEETGDEISISIEGISPEPGDDDETAKPWVKELRQKHRDSQKRIRDLEEENARLKPRTVLPAKPTLESCEYDEAKFEQSLISWNEAKRQADKSEEEKEANNRQLQEDYGNAVKRYYDTGKTLGVKDWNEVTDAAKDTFSVVQQGIIVNGAENSAQVMYALGKNPDKAKELAAIKDPVKFAFAVARLEGKIVMTTKPKTPPERIITRGGSTLSGSNDRQLEQLRAKAEKTGDYTEVVAFKRKLRTAQH